MNGNRAGVRKNLIVKLFSSYFTKAVAFATSLVGHAPADERTEPEVMIEQTARSGRVLPFSVPTPTPTATVGPCLTCHCDHVDVTLLTTHVRYCRCPSCGNAWTEPTKSAHRAQPASFPSEPLKFLRDRN